MMATQKTKSAAKRPAAASSFKEPGLLKRLAAGPVICAEGYVFELERRGYLQAGAYVPVVLTEHPEVVEQLHMDHGTQPQFIASVRRLRSASARKTPTSPSPEEEVGRRGHVPRRGTERGVHRNCCSVQAAHF